MEKARVVRRSRRERITKHSDGADLLDIMVKAMDVTRIVAVLHRRM